MVILMGFGGSILAGCSINVNQETGTIAQQNIPAKDIEQLSIVTETTDVTIQPIDGDEIKVELTGNLSDEKIKLQETTTGNLLNIKVEEGSNVGIHLNMAAHLKVNLPKKMYDALKVDTDTGNIHLEHINSTFDIKSVTGEVKITHLHEFQHHNQVKTDTGNVQVEMSQAPPSLKVDLSTNTGEVRSDFKSPSTESNMTSQYIKGLIGTSMEKSPSLTVHSVTGDISFVKK